MHSRLQLTMTRLKLLADFAAVAVCFVPIFVLIHLDLLYFVNQLCYLQRFLTILRIRTLKK